MQKHVPRRSGSIVSRRIVGRLDSTSTGKVRSGSGGSRGAGIGAVGPRYSMSELLSGAMRRRAGDGRHDE